MSRKVIKNFELNIIGPILYVVRLTSVRWKLELFLVLILCISEFIWNESLLFTIKNKREKSIMTSMAKSPAS
jgi:hypothetical protein